jgi:hypothetical protein
MSVMYHAVHKDQDFLSRLDAAHGHRSALTFVIKSSLYEAAEITGLRIRYQKKPIADPSPAPDTDACLSGPRVDPFAIPPLWIDALPSLPASSVPVSRSVACSSQELRNDDHAFEEDIYANLEDDIFDFGPIEESSSIVPI